MTQGVKRIVPPGSRFGELTVIKEVVSHTLDRRFLCRCSCGKQVTRTADTLFRNRGLTKSCDCLRVKQITTHGLTKHPLSKTYYDMLYRCYKPEREGYHCYGGRGIKVCKEWRGPEGLRAFVMWSENNGWKPGLEIDRKDNNKGYSPHNCRWVTKQVNQCNKRTNVYCTYKGKIVLFHDLWKKFGKVRYQTAHSRYVKYGWDALTSVTKTPQPWGR